MLRPGWGSTVASIEEQQHDGALVEAMARGDRQALAELYERHAARLLGLLQRVLGRGVEAQDLLHDVFLEVWRRAAEYAPERGTVAVWLSLLARSRALDRLRSAAHTRRSGLSDELLRRLSDPSADPARTVEHGKLAQVLQRLGPQEQEVIILGYFGGLSSSEIAEQLEIPIGTVKSRTRGALQKLRQAWEGGGDD